MQFYSANADVILYKKSKKLLYEKTNWIFYDSFYIIITIISFLLILITQETQSPNFNSRWYKTTEIHRHIQGIWPTVFRHPDIKPHPLPRPQYLEAEVAHQGSATPGMNTSKPYHYGSHYSNSGIVLHFLVRMPPFTSMFLDFQGKYIQYVGVQMYSHGFRTRDYVHKATIIAIIV